MEALYLLLSIFTTTATSLFLSIPILLRRLLTTTTHHTNDSIHLYQGTVYHERRRPVHHSFKYSVHYALIDLDQSPQNPNHYLSADEARSFAGTSGSVSLLTIPSSVGYQQNPLSVYYCYDEADVDGGVRVLKKCIAVVTNTPWGEKVRFVFDPECDVVAKPLHVSPFMDMLGNWRIKASLPAESLFIEISVKHPELGDYFTACLRAKRVVETNLVDYERFFWLMPHKVALWIYWHALKLWWKNVSFIQHPRYSNDNYREDALVRNRKLRCCAMSGFGVDKREGGTDSESVMRKDDKDRACVWTDAKWPWS